MVMHEDEGSGCTGPLTTLTIVGQNLALDEGEDPTVTLATYPPLTVCDASASEVVAAMPACAFSSYQPLTLNEPSSRSMPVGPPSRSASLVANSSTA